VRSANSHSATVSRPTASSSATPTTALFPRVAAAVHRGGAGTTTAAAGELDTLVILNRLRACYPAVGSILMDVETLLLQALIEDRYGSSLGWSRSGSGSPGVRAALRCAQEHIERCERT
jgi:hypothetical protein